jgi:hypothetical protein
VALIGDTKRREVLRDIMRILENGPPVGLTKDELLAAVVGYDEYLEANASAVNQSLPQPARSVLTGPQKGALLAYVATARRGDL